MFYICMHIYAYALYVCIHMILEVVTMIIGKKQTDLGQALSANRSGRNWMLQKDERKDKVTE